MAALRKWDSQLLRQGPSMMVGMPGRFAVVGIDIPNKVASIFDGD